MNVRSSFTALVFLLGAVAASAQQDSSTADRTLAPFFFVDTDDPSVDQLPLKSVAAEVHIAGVIADVTIEQVYRNEGTRPLEAIYIFPASTRAAVYGMVMHTGDREIIAEIRDREEARREYEEARERGQTASLLEQERPNVFKMNVANILPGDSIAVRLSYTELLVPTEKQYEFVLPTVVGPRYSPEAVNEILGPDGGERIPHLHEGEDPNMISLMSMLNSSLPHLHEGEDPNYTYAIEMTLAAGLPIQEYNCPTHEVIVEKDTSDELRLTLDPAGGFGGNRDFILRYQLAGQQVESGLLLYEGEEENFFLLMAQPPARPKLSQIPPREYIFLVDVSGSMDGFPLTVSKSLMKNLLGQLRPEDRFNIVLFAGRAAVLSDRSLPTTQENLDQAWALVDGQQGAGRTELLIGLNRAFGLPLAGEGYARIVAVLTDGFVDFEAAAFKLVRERLGQASLFAFGIGSSVNRFAIEGLARAGQGEPFVVLKEGQALDEAARFQTYISTPVLTQVEAGFEGFDAYEVEPAFIPDMLADRPIIVFGKWRGAATGTVLLGGRTGDQAYGAQFDVSTVQAKPTNKALRYLWARHRIDQLSDDEQANYSDALRPQITQLGLNYNLLTKYTSFVAIDRRIRNEDGSETVSVPLPLPEGVEDSAVGNPPLAFDLSDLFGLFGTEEESTSEDDPFGTTAIEGEFEMATWLDRSFYRQDALWIDTSFRLGMPIVEVGFGAPGPDALAPFVGLGLDMLVVLEGQAYRLHAETALPFLQQNAPNPFNGSTVISFQIPASMAGPTRLTIYNLTGQIVHVLTDGHLAAGAHVLAWDGRDESGQEAASGVYIYRLEGTSFAITRRMMLLR
ncbi:MAG: VWA domain-containing protein [Candidatus Latescibacteria bacterium]|nr:VWA domain-containing protein [Candidatus Latescibacterota bacterium]